MAIALVRSLVGPVALGIILFAAAGTIDWQSAWSFVALFAVCNVATNAWLARIDPALVRERTASPIDQTQAWPDRVIAAAILGVLVTWLSLMAVDAVRLHESQAPTWTKVLGGALFVVGFAGRGWVLGVNTFASVAVRAQTERSQMVIRSGPYRSVRHPMYAFMILSLLGTPLLLGSSWGLLGLGVLVPLLAMRAVREEAILRAGLEGYGDYCETVPTRFLPGIW